MASAAAKPTENTPESVLEKMVFVITSSSFLEG
jgi:hypothetical protein